MLAKESLDEGGVGLEHDADEGTLEHEGGVGLEHEHDGDEGGMHLGQGLAGWGLGFAFRFVPLCTVQHSASFVCVEHCRERCCEYPSFSRSRDYTSTSISLRHLHRSFAAAPLRISFSHGNSKIGCTNRLNLYVPPPTLLTTQSFVRGTTCAWRCPTQDQGTRPLFTSSVPATAPPTAHHPPTVRVERVLSVRAPVCTPLARVCSHLPRVRARVLVCSCARICHACVARVCSHLPRVSRSRVLALASVSTC